MLASEWINFIILALTCHFGFYLFGHSEMDFIIIKIFISKQTVVKQYNKFIQSLGNKAKQKKH